MNVEKGVYYNMESALVNLIETLTFFFGVFGSAILICTCVFCSFFVHHLIMSVYKDKGNK